MADATEKAVTNLSKLTLGLIDCCGLERVLAQIKIPSLTIKFAICDPIRLLKPA